MQKKMDGQKFSVCMCVYGKDNPDWFSEAMNSVLCQTCPPDEVVLVVDGPVPETLGQVIRDFEKLDTLRVLWLPQNMGHGIARDKGLEMCSHDLIALMDADDISVPQRFQWLLEAFAADPELSIAGGDIVEFIDDPEHPIGRRQVPQSHGQIREYLKTRCPFNQVSVMLRRSCIDQVGGYQDWYCNEDYYLWVRMYMANMRFANVPQVLVQVRVGRDMYRRRGGWKYFSSEYRLQKLMLKNKIIGPVTFGLNVAKRLIVQVLMPNRLRQWVYEKFARSRNA